MRKALVFLLLVACKSDETAETRPPPPPVPAPESFASGTRLRATFQEVDGVRWFGSWMDTKLGKPCTFEGGRCLTNDVLEDREDTAKFDDAACTGWIVAPATPPIAIAIGDLSQPCVAPKLHAVGERITPTQLYARDATGACVALALNTTQTEYVRLGPELAPEAEPFVRAREENDSAAARIVPRWRIADDGAREIIGAWDNERNELVTRPNDTSGKRWYPAVRAALVGERCPGIATSYDCEPKVAISSPGGCRPPDIYALGPPADASQCGAGPGYQVLGSIPTQTFADAITVYAGDGRVRLAMDARADGTPLVVRGFFDTLAGIACGASFIDEGTLRCKPSADDRATEAYADAACTELAMAWNPAAGACDADPAMPRSVGLRRMGQGSIDVDVGDAIAGAFRKDTSGGCAPYDAGGGISFHRVTPLDEAKLPVLTFRTE
jgi:hypothetical protein